MSGRRRATGGRRRSAVIMSTGSTRTSLARSAVQRKSHYRCRGLRKWCEEQCERTTSSVPDGYPKLGFYCHLHEYQRPKAGKELPDDEQISTWLRRVPSFKEYAAQEEEKTQQLGKDQMFLLRLKEADPPVIKDVSRDGQTYERCFLGSEFASFCARTFPRVYPDPLLGLHYGQALMGGDGMIVAVVSESKQFEWNGVYQLAEDAAQVITLTKREAATVRATVLKARGLPVDPSTRKPVCPYVKVAYRDDGARSDKTKTYKIGRTNLAWRDPNPVFGVTDVSKLKKKVKKQLTPDLLKFEVTAPRDDQVGRLLQTKLLPWKRYRAPEIVPEEWAEQKVDAHAFQFHVPPPRMVYRDHVEKLPFDRSPADISFTAVDVKGGKKGGGFLGEVTIPITALFDTQRNKGKRCQMYWARLRPKPREEEAEVQGELLVRVQLLLPTDDIEDFGDSSDDDDDSDVSDSDVDSDSS